MSELVTFHGDTRLIIVEPGITEIDVEQDVYSAWKRWMVLSDNAKWPIAMRTVGGDPLSSTKTLGATFFLLNDWRIRPQEADHWLTVNGNLYTDPSGSSPFVATLGAFTVTISMVVSNLSDASLAQMAEIEYSSFGGAVTIDVDAGVAGTAYPTGTPLQPVNNLADAKVIATARGFTTLRLLSGLTITTGQDVSDYCIESETWKIVTVEAGAITTNTEFHRIDLYGELSGSWNVLDDCWIEDVTNFLGWVRGGSSIAHVELAPYIDPDPTTLGSSFFDDLVPMFADIPSTLVLNDAVRVSFTNCADMVEISNLTDGSVVNAGLSGGMIHIDSSCVGGDMLLSGVGTYVNDGGGTFALDTSGLVNPAAVWDLGDGVELALTPRQAMRLIAAASAGKLSGAEGTEIRIRDLADSTDRIVATVDEAGNRLAVTTDVT